MSEKSSAWPIRFECCVNSRFCRKRGSIAFTILRSSFSSQSNHFGQIAAPETRKLFHFFLELCSRLSSLVPVKCLLELVLESSSSSYASAYTFFLLIDCDNQNALINSEFDSMLAAALKYQARRSLNGNKPWMSWIELSSLSRVKNALHEHLGFSASNASLLATADKWAGLAIDGCLVFSLTHALGIRLHGHPAQTGESALRYLSHADHIRFPVPEYVYVILDEDVREPSILSSRLFPDWQVVRMLPCQSTFFSCLGCDSSSDQKSDDTSVTLRLYELELHVSPILRRDFASLTFGCTYDEIRGMALARLAVIDSVANQQNTVLGRLPDPNNAARRLYRLHQRLSIHAHVSQLRGAFPDNISPHTKFLMDFAEQFVFHSVLPSDRSGLGFCERELARARDFRDVVGIVNHNVLFFFLVFYASLDAYSFEPVCRTRINLLFHSEESGLGKSAMIKTALEKVRVHIDVVTHKTALSQTVSSKYAEQSYRQVVIEELSESLLGKKGKMSHSDETRMLKTMLSNPLMHAESLGFERETGARIQRIDTSLWLGVCLSACNIPRLLSHLMEPAMIDRHVVITLDQSEKAKRAITAKIREMDRKERDPVFQQQASSCFNRYKIEEVLYAETKMVERECGLRQVSNDVAYVIHSFVESRLSVRNEKEMTVRDREKSTALAGIIATIDAINAEIDNTTVDPFRLLPAIEQRNWIRAAHVVHAIGIAPSLLIDTDERLVRLVLFQEARDRIDRSSFSPDNIYFSFPLLNTNGIEDLASRLHNRLRSQTTVRQITKDAIEYRLRAWLRRMQRTRPWIQSVLPDSAWPVELVNDKPEEKALARIDERSSGCSYQIQIAWIHPEKIPRFESTHILLDILREFFAHRHQGGFRAPFGVNPVTGEVRIVFFPHAVSDAPLLESNDTFPGNVNVDMWGMKQHFNRIYLHHSPVTDICLLHRSDTPNGYFFGKNINEIMLASTIAETVDNVRTELLRHPEVDADWPEQNSGSSKLLHQLMKKKRKRELT